jgi:hypothetical protein
MLMFVKRHLRPADELGKMIDVVEYLSRYASGNLSANICATTYLLICLVDYIIVELKKTRLTHGKSLLNRKSKVLSF